MTAIEPIIVSYSELDTYRQCPLKHHITYGQRWTKPPKEGGALHKGNLWHSVMETHYRTIKAWQDVHDGKSPAVGSKDETDLLRDCADLINFNLLFDQRTGAQDDVQELVSWMYEGYIQNYRLDAQWKIVGIEHAVRTPLLDARGRKTRYHIKAKLDLIVQERFSGHLWVIDHKSGKDLPTQMDLEIDDQFGLYCWILRQLGRPVMGAIHSANRTQRNKSPMSLDQRMSRTYLNRGETELTNLAYDAYEVARAAHPPKGGRVARYSSPDPRQCGWKCDIKEPHLIARTGVPIETALRDYGFRIDRTRH